RIASGSGGYDEKAKRFWGEVKVWDAHTGQEQLTLKGHTAQVNSVAFSADGKRIASGSGGYDEKANRFWGAVKVWDAHTGQETLPLQRPTAQSNIVASTVDGTRIASGSGRYDEKAKRFWGEVKVWDAQTGQQALTLKGHTAPVSSVAFSPDGRRIASGSL